MLRLSLACLLVVVATAAAGTAVLAAPHDNCNFGAAVDQCQNHLGATGRCAYFKCLVDHCPTSTMLDVARTWCGTPLHPAPKDADKPLVAGGIVAMIRESKPRAGEDSDDRQPASVLAAQRNVKAAQLNKQAQLQAEGADDAAVEAVMPSEEEQYVKRVLEANRMKHGVVATTLPDAASPCELETRDWSRVKAQQLLHHAAWSAYASRHTARHTSEPALRWADISSNACPRSHSTESASNAPELRLQGSDASSFVTWIYYTVFGAGADFVNGAEQAWKAGYTGTLLQNGKAVHAADVQIGDLCFYNAGEEKGTAATVKHVAIYVGSGMVMSHGHDPIGFFKIDYAPLHSCRRYI